MIDLSDIAGAGTAIKSALDLARALVGGGDAKAIEGKLVQLREHLTAAHERVLATHIKMYELLDRNRTLEAEAMKAKDWSADALTYELKAVGRGTLAYVRKEPKPEAEPDYYLCPNCFLSAKKSIFQATPDMITGRRAYACPVCKLKIGIGA